MSLRYDLFDPLYSVRVFLLACGIKWQIFVMKKFMLGRRFRFEAYAKNVNKNAAKCS